jgi:MFS family permease
VGIGEASFVTIAPALLADLYSEDRRGRILSIFYIAIPVGTAMGYLVGGWLGPSYGWRTPFYVAAAPGVVLSLAMLALAEPQRGQSDLLHESAERASIRGLARNPAFWTATLGMAMLTFSLGGLSVWMPTFLSRNRGLPLKQANEIFGLITGFNGIVATLIGGWLGDRLLRRSAGAYYWLSGFAMAAAIPAMAVAIYVPGFAMYPAMFVAEFLIFLNTGPLNAAVVNSVGAHIRATAIAVNLFVIHLLGDVPAPPLIGKISDSTSLETAFITALIANALSAIILFYGARFAPAIPEPLASSC